MHRAGDSRRKRARKPLHLRLDLRLKVERVRARLLEHRHDHGRVLAEKAGRRIFQRPQFPARHVAQPHDRAAGGIGAQHDLREFFGVAQPPRRIDLRLERRAGGRGRSPDLARRDLHVLFVDRALHVERRQAQIGELVGVEPDAQGTAAFAENLPVAHAGQSFELIDDAQISVVGERDRIDAFIGRGEIDDEDEIRVPLLDRHAALIDEARQPGGRLRHAVLHVEGGDVERIADLERDGDGRGAVVGA